MPAELPLRSNKDVLKKALGLKGLTIADLGAGEGGLARWLAKQGAEVIAVEPQWQQIKGLSFPALAAFGQQLPFRNDFLDVALYFNSLHHVPVAGIPAAISEAWRVLKQGGHLAAIEPIAAGLYFEMARVIDDETEVRAQALASLRLAEASGHWRRVEEQVYNIAFSYPDAATWLQSYITVDASRRAVIETKGQELIEQFARIAMRDEEGQFCFHHPTRFTLLQKV